MAVKTYKVKETIRGKEYEAQFNGLRAYMRAVDDFYKEGSQTPSMEKMADYVFEHVIINPKGLDPDDFDDYDELNEVVTFGRDVMQGKFRAKANKGTAKAEDKE